MKKTNIELFRESAAISNKQNLETSKIYKKIELRKQEILKAEREIKTMQIDIQKVKEFYEMKKEKLWDEYEDD